MSDNYTREDVEDALWLMWDPDRSLGPGRDEQQPEGDMPRSKNDPSHGMTWMATLADIKSAWRRAGLTHTEQYRLALYYGQGLTNWQIGYLEYATKQSVNECLDNGLNKLVRTINTNPRRKAPRGVRK